MSAHCWVGDGFPDLHHGAGVVAAQYASWSSNEVDVYRNVGLTDIYTQKEMIVRTALVCGVEGYGGGFDKDIVIAEVGNRMVLDRNCVAL